MLRCVALLLASGLASALFSNKIGKKPLPANLPQWGSSYMVQGVIHLPRSEVEEHFQAWFDGSNWRSRVDYNGGTVKTYQMPMNDKTKGSLLKVFPYSDENTLNVPRCIFAPYPGVFMPQPGLPDTTGFKLKGSEDFFGDKAFKWQRESVHGSHQKVYSLWVKYKKDGDTVRSIPLKYESQQIDTEKGTLMDHFFFHYTNYVIGDMDGKTFDIGLRCATQNDDSVMNPINELIDNTHINHVEKEFNRFKSKHGLRYAADDHNERLTIFRHNLRYIQAHNRAGHSFTLEVNHLADRTPDEVAALRGLLRGHPSDPRGQPFPYSDADIQKLTKDLPQDFDWRLQGAVTPVKNQGYCGSCWAFSSVGAVEGALFQHSKRLVRLSEQALMDCSWGFNNGGCGGGLPDRAFSWIAKHGLPSDEAYGGYLEQYGRCHIENVTKTTFIDNFVKVTHDEHALQLAIFKHGPISVAIDASHKSFRFYSQGVYYEPHCNSDNLDHAVLAVGFGVQNGQKYWLVKNSWGPEWGSNGYILMSAKNNNCGIQNYPYYVTISK